MVGTHEFLSQIADILPGKYSIGAMPSSRLGMMARWR